MNDAKAIINDILIREGWPEFIDHPADRGGPTKGGITLESWGDYSGDPTASIEVLKVIREGQARVFYHYRYVTGPRFYRIANQRLLGLVVDAAVHHGPRRAAKWLQRAANVKQDGDVGDITIAAVNSSDPQKLYLLIIAFRIKLFGRLIGRDPELARAQRAGFNLQARWAGGWNNRVAEFIEALARRLDQAEIAQ